MLSSTSMAQVKEFIFQNRTEGNTAYKVCGDVDWNVTFALIRFTKPEVDEKQVKNFLNYLNKNTCSLKGLALEKAKQDWAKKNYEPLLPLLKATREHLNKTNASPDNQHMLSLYL